MSVYYMVFPPLKHDMNGKFNLCTSPVCRGGAGLAESDKGPALLGRRAGSAWAAAAPAGCFGTTWPSPACPSAGQGSASLGAASSWVGIIRDPVRRFVQQVMRLAPDCHPRLESAKRGVSRKCECPRKRPVFPKSRSQGVV